MGSRDENSGPACTISTFPTELSLQALLTVSYLCIYFYLHYSSRVPFKKTSFHMKGKYRERKQKEFSISVYRLLLKSLALISLPTFLRLKYAQHVLRKQLLRKDNLCLVTTAEGSMKLDSYAQGVSSL